MTSIFINHRLLNNDYNKNATINEIIQAQDALNPEMIITSLELDGDDILSPSNLELDQSIGSFKDIKITLQTPLNLALESLDDSSRYIENIIFSIKDTVQLYEQNLHKEANQKFAEVIDIMDLFIQLISKINSTIKKHKGRSLSDNQDYQKLEIHLLSVLKTLLPAKERNDIIMLCDLLEYELIDNLEQWKTQVIPTLKKIGQG